MPERRKPEPKMDKADSRPDAMPDHNAQMMNAMMDKMDQMMAMMSKMANMMGAEEKNEPSGGMGMK